MPRYTWINKRTGEKAEIDRLVDNRNLPPDEGLPEDWERELSMPAFKRATYLDGQRAKTDKNFQKAKTAAGLEVDFAESTDKRERSEIRKSIDTLTKL